MWAGGRHQREPREFTPIHGSLGTQLAPGVSPESGGKDAAAPRRWLRSGALRRADSYRGVHLDCERAYVVASESSGRSSERLRIGSARVWARSYVVPIAFASLTMFERRSS
jgi:hypothetical protein